MNVLLLYYNITVSYTHLKLQEVLVKRLSENTVSDYLETTNMDFLDMFLTAKHLEGCSDKIIRYYRLSLIHI